MSSLPDHYESLGISSHATPQEIERAYRQRAAELRRSKVADAAEELEEVQAAYAILGNPEQRARYDAQVRKDEAEDDRKNADLDAYLKRHHHRKHVSGSTSWLDAIGAILKLFS